MTNHADFKMVEPEEFWQEFNRFNNNIPYGFRLDRSQVETNLEWCVAFREDLLVENGLNRKYQVGFAWEDGHIWVTLSSPARPDQPYFKLATTPVGEFLDALENF